MRDPLDRAALTTPTVHIYTRPWQPATRWVDVVHIGYRSARYPGKAKRIVLRNPGNRLLATSCCRKRRPAKNLRVQVYYDMIRVGCVPGKGCKR